MSAERRNPNSVDIDLYPTERILKIINSEDASVAALSRPQFLKSRRQSTCAVTAIQNGGRIIYVGAGTSGRIAFLDAAECPPTFSSPPDWIQAIIAGGAKAVTEAFEGAEDDRALAEADLKDRSLDQCRSRYRHRCQWQDSLHGCCSGICKEDESRHGFAVISSPDSPMTKTADVVICVPVGPEIITGSTRMKSGTSQKLVLNMISTATMIRLGMTYSNWMINVSMTNKKLKERGVQILREILGVNTDEAQVLTEASGGKLKLAVIMGTLGCDRKEAEQRLAQGKGNLRKVLGHLGCGRE
jgi:N-acetylmuramic acid 6-phosphate etherase